MATEYTAPKPNPLAKRIVKAEKRIKELEATVAELKATVEELKTASSS